MSKGVIGRSFFSEEENSNLARVAILGHTVKQELFGDGEGYRSENKN